MKIEEFFKSFQEQHDSCLEINDFSSMLALLPGALVAKADGKLGALEKQNLVSAMKVSSYGKRVIMCEMYENLCYLVQADESMQNAALECIKEEIAKRVDLQKIVLDIMISTAETQDGISDCEQQKIDQIRKLLNI